jgi:hypothetical protein
MGIRDSLRCDQHKTPMHGQSWETSGTISATFPYKVHVGTNLLYFSFKAFLVSCQSCCSVCTDADAVCSRNIFCCEIVIHCSFCSAASRCVIELLVDNPFTFTHLFVVFCWATCFGLYDHHQARVHVFKLLHCSPRKNIYRCISMLSKLK